MTKKADFVMAVQEASTLLARLAPKYKELFEAYFDRGYNGGGSDPIVDGDIPPELEVEAADIAAFITLTENLGLFLNYDGVTAPFLSDYATTINRLRTDI